MNILNIVHQKLSSKIQKCIVDSNNDVFVRCLCFNKYLDEDIQIELLKSKYAVIVAYNKHISEKTMHVLCRLEFNDHNHDLIIHLCPNESITDSVVEKIIDLETIHSDKIKRNFNYSCILARNIGVNSKFHLKFANHSYSGVRVELASNRTISEDIQIILANDECYGVLYKLQYNIGLTKNASDALMENRIMKLQRKSNNLIENVFKRLYTA